MIIIGEYYHHLKAGDSLIHELIVQRAKEENLDIKSILSGIKKQNLPSKKQSKLKLLLRNLLDLIFKLIPRKVLEKLFKIYY